MSLFVIGLLSACLCTYACTVGPAKTKDISVAVTVPDLGWRIRIQEIYQVGEELWVISVLSRIPGVAAQMVTTVSDTVSATVPVLPVKHVVLGKTWGWRNKEDYVFVTNIREIDEHLKAGKLLFQRDKNGE